MDVPPRLRIYRPADFDPAADEASSPMDAPAMDSSVVPAGSVTVPTDPLLDAAAVGDSDVGQSLWRRLVPFTGSLLLLVLLSGCAACRPLPGTPVRFLAPEYHGPSRANMETIDLSRLGQTPAPAYLLDSGDVLAIYIEGVLGRVEEVPPVFIPQNGVSNPSLGYPIPVREDGTISLPLIPPLNVRGMTIPQVEDLVRRTYTADRQILEKGHERIMVSLQRARTYKITVLRQETSNVPLVGQSSGSIQLGQSKKGTGQIVILQAGENDVLHGLTVSGGLPGLDAQNAIYVLKRPRPQAFPHHRPITTRTPSKAFLQTGTETPIQLTSGQGAYAGRDDFVTPATGKKAQWGHSLPEPDPTQPVELEGNFQPVPQANSGYAPGAGGAPLDSGLGQGGAYCPPELRPYLSSGVHIVRIPIRLHAGEEALFSEPDIILFDGDIIFIESRETEVFYTGGLLGGGQYLLPRDYDLDVLDAIAVATSQQVSTGGNGFGSRIGGISAVNQDISVSASDLVVMRRFPDGQRMNIKINLNRALRDPTENLIIQPGDRLILRYRPLEAIGAFIERNLLAGAVFSLAAQQATAK